jgi:hypothetical protein
LIQVGLLFDLLLYITDYILKPLSQVTSLQVTGQSHTALCC